MADKVSFVGPHEPFDTPAEWNKRIRIQAPDPKPAWIDNLPENSTLKKTKERWEDSGINAYEIEECRQDYINHLRLLDQQIKKLLKELGRNKDNTDIVITSDHGEMLGDAGMLYKAHS